MLAVRVGEQGCVVAGQQTMVLCRGSRLAQVVLGTENGTVQYYDGAAWAQLQPLGWGSAVALQAVQWAAAPGARPQVVAALGNGSVRYYTGQAWAQLHDDGWATGTAAMAVEFRGPDPPQVVVGLLDGSVQYCPGIRGGGGGMQQIPPGAQQVSQLAVKFPATPGDPGDGNQYFFPELVIGLGGLS